VKKKVLVGMSGGVDSSVAASMLIEQGYDVHGVFVEAYNEPGCRTDQDKKDALQVALKLGIPFTVLDLRKEYKERVVNYFIDEYKQGRTPNPDIICNRDIKFGLLYEYMEQNGYNYLATGHYARINNVNPYSYKSVNLFLQMALDSTKDQSYFLWQVAREKLDKIMWPLGNVEKSWVRKRARELGLPNADKPDSMGVCMIGELNVTEFLKDKLGTKKGDVVWKNQVIGVHDGLWFYTIGARGGWKVKPEAQSASMPPLYVTAKNLKLNTLEVGVREECYCRSFEVSELVGEVMNNKDIRVRVRNLGELTRVKEIVGNTVNLEEPIFALAPGQSAVFYDESGCVVGGGIIV
jgi:tRNA-specific 2-thiouridylase